MLKLDWWFEVCLLVVLAVFIGLKNHNDRGNVRETARAADAGWAIVEILKNQ